MKCLRCETEMNHIMREKLQLGQTGWFLGDLPNLIAGALEVDVYGCPKCGKLEFFQTRPEVPETTVTQVKCPKCGKKHDFDWPKCPFCGHDYYNGR